MENVLLDENHNAKLIDFGFSICSPNAQKIKVYCGTPAYMVLFIFRLKYSKLILVSRNGIEEGL